MKKICFVFVMIARFAIANQWANYAAFEVDATNALSNIGMLMSDEFTNRLSLCRAELDPTNEMSSAALLLLAISDDAKSNNIEEFVGDTNSLVRVLWFLNYSATERTLWQKSCAMAMLSSGNTDPSIAAEYFSCATNILHQWDSMTNCFSGGVIYQNIARYCGVSELDARASLVFAAADSAKIAGMASEFSQYASMLPPETQIFLNNQ